MGRDTVRTDGAIRSGYLKRIAVCMPLISRLNGQRYHSNGLSDLFQKIGICSNGSSYPFKKISICLNGLSYPLKKISIHSNGLSYLLKEKNCQLFERFELSIQVTHSNGSSYPFKKNCQPLERFELSRSKKFVNRSSYLLEKNKTVTSSFHWKVKYCEWNLCGNVFMSFRKYLL